MKIVVNKLDTRYGCLSNFYKRPFTYDGRIYGNAEAAFQSMKTDDPIERDKFSSLSPTDAKRLGKQEHLVPDWEQIKYEVMVDILTAKFSEHEYLKTILLETKDALIVEETTWHDNCWGYCTCPRCRCKNSTNLLGRALMEVRSTLSGNPNCAKFKLSGKEFYIDFNSEEFSELEKSENGAYILDKIWRYAE